MVPVTSSHKLHISPIVGTNMMLRATVASKLHQVAESLPDGYTLILIEGYRSFSRQKAMWEEQFEKVKSENAKLPLHEIERITRLSVAQPSTKGSGHQTGGAVDVTLGDQLGRQLDMGTAVQEFQKYTPSHARVSDSRIRYRRTLLKDTMEKQGFSNYPGEWWHFSFGDKMWAAYTRSSIAFYDATNA